jgi:hypothetical protein
MELAISLRILRPTPNDIYARYVEMFEIKCQAGDQCVPLDWPDSIRYMITFSTDLIYPPNPTEFI